MKKTDGLKNLATIEYLHKTPVKDIKKTVALLDGNIKELTEEITDLEWEEDYEGLTEVYSEIKEKQQVYRIMRGYYDVLYFAYEYFSDDKNPTNETNLIPEDVSIKDAPDFHKELCSKLDEVVENPIKKIGWGAPRGHAKSAYLTNIYPVHAVVYQTKQYIIVLSETKDMAVDFIEFISTNLKMNPKINEDFGEVLSKNSRHNQQDNNEEFVSHSDIKVQASSIGGQLRGSRFRNARPDLIICDDLESGKNTNTEELREKNLHWFNSTIEPIGTPDKTAFIYMGTLVHGQGLLPNVLNRPEYDSAIYSSVVDEPERTDLWDAFENILNDVENSNRAVEAKSFYQKNKEEMDRGVKVLWEDRFSYIDLMIKKADIGSRAFASEYLNVPSDEDSAVFQEEYLEYFEDNQIYESGRLSNVYTLYAFWDIAMGKNKRSDYNAIVVIAKHKRSGVIYVLEAWAKKCRPHEAMNKAVDIIKQYSPAVFGVETINAQFEFYTQLQKRATQEGLFRTRIKAVNPKTKKEQRIEALEPLFEQGYIRIRRTQRLLKEMILQYPNHTHDDLPDCLSGAMELSRFRKRRAFRKPDGY